MDMTKDALQYVVGLKNAEVITIITRTVRSVGWIGGCGPIRLRCIR